MHHWRIDQILISQHLLPCGRCRASNLHLALLKQGESSVLVGNCCFLKYPELPLQTYFHDFIQIQKSPQHICGTPTALLAHQFKIWDSLELQFYYSVKSKKSLTIPQRRKLDLLQKKWFSFLQSDMNKSE